MTAALQRPQRWRTESVERYLAHPAHRSTHPASLLEVPFCPGLTVAGLSSFGVCVESALKKREDSNFLVEHFILFLNPRDIYMYFFFPFLIHSFPFPFFPLFPFPVLWLLHTGPFLSLFPHNPVITSLTPKG